MVTNVEHLKHVPRRFAAMTDLLLVVGVGDSEDSVKFPVHAVIVSGRSEVLQDVIAQLAVDTAQSWPTTLSMYGDDPAGVQAALDCIYMPYAEAGSCKRKPGLIRRSQAPAVMLLAHKYKMHTLLSDVVSAMHAAFNLTANCKSPAGQDEVQGHLELVVKVAAAADICQEGLLLTDCERHLIINFDRLGDELINKLPAPSLARFTLFFRKELLESQVDMRQRLDVSHAEAREAARMIYRKIQQCPRWCGGQLTSGPSCSNAHCKWPSAVTTVDKSVDEADCTDRACTVGLAGLTLLILLTSLATTVITKFCC